jgi:hypothetical protein
MKRTQIGSAVQIKTYEVVTRAVEAGIAYGVNRATKHSTEEIPHHVIEQLNVHVLSAVMAELSDVLIFPELEAGEE